MAPDANGNGPYVNDFAQTRAKQTGMPPAGRGPLSPPNANQSAIQREISNQSELVDALRSALSELEQRVMDTLVPVEGGAGTDAIDSPVPRVGSSPLCRGVNENSTQIAFILRRVQALNSRFET